MARIAIGGFHHETNCFVDSCTDFAYFASHRDRPPLCYGADVVKWLTGTTFALWGFMKDMAPAHELVPLAWTSGGAGGMVTRDAFERIAGSLVGHLSEAMPVESVQLRAMRVPFGVTLILNHPAGRFPMMVTLSRVSVPLSTVRSPASWMVSFATVVFIVISQSPEAGGG